MTAGLTREQFRKVAKKLGCCPDDEEARRLLAELRNQWPGLVKAMPYLFGEEPMADVLRKTEP